MPIPYQRGGLRVTRAENGVWRFEGPYLITRRQSVGATMVGRTVVGRTVVGRTGLEPVTSAV